MAIPFHHESGLLLVGNKHEAMRCFLGHDRNINMQKHIQTKISYSINFQNDLFQEKTSSQLAKPTKITTCTSASNEHFEHPKQTIYSYHSHQISSFGHTSTFIQSHSHEEWYLQLELLIHWRKEEGDERLAAFFANLTSKIPKTPG